MVECKYFRTMGTLRFRMRPAFFVNIQTFFFCTQCHSLKAHHTAATIYFNLENLVIFNIIYQTVPLWANMKFSQ